MKKLNLLVDWSYMMHKCVSVYESVDAASGDPKLTSDADKALYARKIITDMCFALRKFSGISLDKVIMTIDSRSWRKDVEIPNKPSYKDNRKEKTSTVNWKGFYEVSDDLIGILENFGFYISKVKAAEADDLMFLYANKFLAQDEDTIVLTGDRDLWQLVNYNEDKRNFSIVYVNNSKYSKLICDSDTVSYINEDKDIEEQLLSALSASNIDLLEGLANREGLPIVELDPYNHAFLKIFTGDKGDDVPPLFEWEVKQKTRTVIGKFTEKRIAKVWELMDKNYVGFDKIFKLEDNVKAIIPMLKKVAPLYDLSEQETIERINRNITLMVLHEDVMPKHVMEGFEKDYVKLYDTIGHIIHKFNPNNFRTQIILKNTKFEKEPSKMTGFMREGESLDENAFFDSTDEPTIKLF